MQDIVNFEKARLNLKSRKAFRNWSSRFGEEFSPSTRLSHINIKTLSFLARGRGENAFYLYDLIMNLHGLGSGFEIHELEPKHRMRVIDQYLFLLDRIRYEYMKRLGWLESYSGETHSLVEMVLHFERLAPGMQAKPPLLSKDHSLYPKFSQMNIFEKEELIKSLVPLALKKIPDHSDTL